MEEYTLRNADFTPIRVRDFFGLLNLEEDRSQLKAQKQKTRTEKGVALTCVQGRDQGFPKESREVCVDTASRDLVKDTRQYQSEAKRIEQLSVYADFNGQRLPHHLERLSDSHSLISVNIASIQPLPFEPSLLEPPQRGRLNVANVPD